MNILSRSAPFTLAFATLVTCYFCSGCVPVSEHYQRAEAPEAVYLQGLCGGSGAPNWTYYPFHGIFISVSLSPLQLGLHYQAGTTVEFDGDTVTISGLRQNEPIQLTVHLSPAPHAALGNGAPEEFDAMTDPMDPGGKSGYHRSSKGLGLIWANFMARDVNTPNRSVRVPIDMERAKIVIPAMTINGQRYESQELVIVRKKYSGVVPINC
jgi:hypothetical protein